MLFGLGDVWVALAFYLMILSAGMCLVYGAVNWNRGEAENGELRDEAAWAREERVIEEGL